MEPNPNLTFQKCDLEVLSSLREISLSTFTDTYSQHNNPIEFQQYLREAFSEENLRSELENSDSRFYFCYYNETLAGYLKLNFASAQTDIRDQKSLEIERIYVIKEMQGKGIGRALLDLSISIAKEKLLDHIWLGVWKKNPRAIAFYEHLGFRQFDTHFFRIGSDLQEDALMRRSVSDPAI